MSKTEFRDIIARFNLDTKAIDGSKPEDILMLKVAIARLLNLIADKL